MLVRRAVSAVRSHPTKFLAASTGAVAAAAVFAATSASPATTTPRSFLNPIRLFASSPLQAQSAMSYPVNKSDSEWRAQLSPEQFKILREKGTEMAGTGEYDKHYPDKVCSSRSVTMTVPSENLAYQALNVGRVRVRRMRYAALHGRHE